jgi:hypothetical protein
MSFTKRLIEEDAMQIILAVSLTCKRCLELKEKLLGKMREVSKEMLDLGFMRH